MESTLQDVPLIAGYLHDAEFRPTDLAFDGEQGTLTLKLRRICYERPEKGRFLLLFPVIRFPWIESSLVVTGVRGLTQHWLKRWHADSGEPCLLLDVTRKDGSTLEFQSDFLTAKASISPGSRLLLEDLSDPLPGSKVIDCCRSVFRSMQEIERLRRNAQPRR